MLYRKKLVSLKNLHSLLPQITWLSVLLPQIPPIGQETPESGSSSSSTDYVKNVYVVFFFLISIIFIDSRSLSPFETLRKVWLITSRKKTSMVSSDRPFCFMEHSKITVAQLDFLWRRPIRQFEKKGSITDLYDYMPINLSCVHAYD